MRNMAPNSNFTCLKHPVYGSICRLFIPLFWVLILEAPLQAQAELRSDSNHVETGNPFQLLIRFPATLGKPDSLNFDAWAGALPAQNIVNQSEWENNGGYFSKSLTALFFDEDTLQLPPLPIALRHHDTIYSNPLQIVVTATPAPDDLNDMAGLKDIHREGTHWIDYLPWVLGVLSVLAILWFFYRMAHRKAAARIQSRTFEIPADELALKKLQALEQKNWIAAGQIKAHYAELTFILREYLEKRYGIPALESTSHETLGHLKNHDFPEALAQPLQTLLVEADLAKFAKIIPPETFHSESFELTKRIIRDTSQALHPSTDEPR